jgi:hypothetical protein
MTMLIAIAFFVVLLWLGVVILLLQFFIGVKTVNRDVDYDDHSNDDHHSHWH